MIVGTLLSMCYIVASPFLPTKTEIIETGKLVNGYWIKNHSQGGNNDWARSVYYVGNTCFYKYFPKAIYLEYSTAWAESHHWKLRSSGPDHADAQVWIYISWMEKTGLIELPLSKKALIKW